MKNQRGQTATEYMLIVAVIVLGLVSAASYFVPAFKSAVTEKLVPTITSWLSNDPNFKKPD